MSKETLKNLMNANFPDNNTKYISPAKAREFFDQFIDESQLEVSSGAPIKFTRSFSLSDPVMDGQSFSIPTSLPAGSRIDGMSIIGEDLPSSVDFYVYVSSVADGDLYLVIDTDTVNNGSSSFGPISKLTTSAAVVIVKAVGGNVISGSVSFKIFVY